MAITMTDFAIDRLSSLMKRTGCEGLHLRVALRGGGCSGYSYSFDFTDKVDKFDKIFDFKEVKICVDRKSYLFLNGMEVDYEESPFKSGIVINNPNAKNACGCGESVSF